MEPSIIDREETIFVGVVSEGEDIYQLWQTFDFHVKEIKHKIDGACYELHTYPEDPQSGNAPEYLVSVAVTAVEDVPEGLVVRRLPAGRYAVFTHRLANGGFTGCNDTMNAWLKNGTYKLSPNASIQVFDARFKGPDNPESVIDFLLPVVAK